MTKQEFSKAVKLAESKIDLSEVDDSILDGCGLKGFKPVAVTLPQVARFIRWQALQFNGQWNAQELDNCYQIGRTKFHVV